MFHYFDQNRIRCGKPKTNRAAISMKSQAICMGEFAMRPKAKLMSGDKSGDKFAPCKQASETRSEMKSVEKQAEVDQVSVCK